jgi:hypothetical protein
VSDEGVRTVAAYPALDRVEAIMLRVRPFA